MSRAKDWPVWVQYAENTWHSANILLELYPSDAAYSLSQSAEKYLKAFLIFQQKRVPFSHDLDHLLVSAFPKADQLLRQAAILLNLAANRSRYPGELESPNFDEVQAFRNAALMIRQSVRSALQLEDKS